MFYSDDWWASALCRQFDPEMWFSSNYRPAIMICNECVVINECLEDALSYPTNQDAFGVRGGMTPSARNKLRKTRKINNSIVN